MLNNIDNPKFLKSLSIFELKKLAEEIRRFLIESTSKTGGHLASNLGVVELTIALHYCLDAPLDKIVWDVGHQAYTHKILTGRAKKFNTLRKLGGLSGFPRIKESEFDLFDAGHSSTSISLACGLAAARDLAGENYNVAAVIGDGSMTGGTAYEALNNVGNSGTKMMVILNDNQMSIAQNVGALSTYLNNIRTARAYLGAKKNVHFLLDKIPYMGEKAASFVERVKNGIKYFVVPGVFFEELGFTYLGPVDGHNIDSLIKAINQCKRMETPVLLHVLTKKGKGYFPAEKRPEKFHGIGKFNINSGASIKRPVKTFTDVFDSHLVKLAEKDEKIVAVTAAMTCGVGLKYFSQKFAHRLFDVGIAEGHAAAFCAGLAKGGFKPVFAVYSSFLQRAYDQILEDVCLNELPVVFAVDRAGIVGSDGETHQGIYDISFLSHLPMEILAPRDGRELKLALNYAFKIGQPIAVRYPKSALPAKTVFTQEDYFLRKFVKIRETTPNHGEICVVSVGAMFETALEVCEELEQKFKVTLIDARFIKPISGELLEEISKYKYVFTLEDNIITGGFGAYLTSKYAKIAKIFAFPDEFIPHGERKEIFSLYGLDKYSIMRDITEIVDGTS